jgi:hypothetical protein
LAGGKGCAGRVFEAAQNWSIAVVELRGRLALSH